VSVESGGQTTSAAAIPLEGVVVHPVVSALVNAAMTIQRIMGTSVSLDHAIRAPVATPDRLTERHTIDERSANRAQGGHAATA
jgi:hypothetical protein